MAHHDTELLSAEISDRLKKSRHRQLIVERGEKYAREKKKKLTLSCDSCLSANRKFRNALSIGVLKTIIFTVVFDGGFISREKFRGPVIQL